MMFWKLYSICYDALLRLVPYQEMMRIAKLGASVTPGMNILDAGCGTGNLISSFRTEGVKIVGIDSSEAMLERAKKKTPDATFVWADLNQVLPFSDHSFDAVFCINALYTVTDIAFTTSELRRVLKDSGRLVVSTPRNKPRMDRILGEHLRRAGLPQTLLLLPALVLVAAFNYIIVKRGNRGAYHFLSEAEVIALQPETTAITYAKQNWLLTWQR